MIDNNLTPLQFRIWLESLIDRNKARKMVLDAIDVPETSNNVGDVLGTLIRQRPDLEKKLAAYSDLRSYFSKISAWMRGNENKTLQQLIDFISTIDDPSPPQIHTQPSVGVPQNSPSDPI